MYLPLIVWIRLITTVNTNECIQYQLAFVGCVCTSIVGFCGYCISPLMLYFTYMDSATLTSNVCDDCCVQYVSDLR